MSQRIIEKYDDRVPVIVNSYPRSNVAMLAKKKYIVPSDITMGRFVNNVRKNMDNINSSQALYMYVGNVLVSNTILMSQVYEMYKSDDGFLYITYALENTFG